MSKTEVTGYIPEGVAAFCIAIAVIAGLIVGYQFGHNRAKSKYKTERININTNDSIKLQVKQLDSLKNEKVIEVKGLSNDSTLKLFKQLVDEE